MKIYLISFLIILYNIIYFTLKNPYTMIPFDCIMIYIIYKINPLYDNNKLYFNKRDRRDILYSK